MLFPEEIRFSYADDEDEDCLTIVAEGFMNNGTEWFCDSTPETRRVTIVIPANFVGKVYSLSIRH